jgi:CRP-like cAMP-binding protein
LTTIDFFRKDAEASSYAAGQIVFNQGDAADTMYVVTEGEVEIRIGDRIIDRVGPGGILGEMALVDDKPRSATAVASVNSKLVPISQKRFLFLVQQTPFFAIQVMQVMADRLRRLMAA